MGFVGWVSPDYTLQSQAIYQPEDGYLDMYQRGAPELNPLLGLVSLEKVLMQLHFFQSHLVVLLCFASGLCQLRRHHADK